MVRLSIAALILITVGCTSTKFAREEHGDFFSWYQQGTSGTRHYYGRGTPDELGHASPLEPSCASGGFIPDYCVRVAERTHGNERLDSAEVGGDIYYYIGRDYRSDDGVHVWTHWFPIQVTGGATLLPILIDPDRAKCSLEIDDQGQPVLCNDVMESEGGALCRSLEKWCCEAEVDGNVITWCEWRPSKDHGDWQSCVGLPTAGGDCPPSLP